MKIYLTTGRRDHLVIVQPGADEEFEGASHSGFFTVENGAHVPITFKVEFKDGKAEVDSPLGEYLIAKGIAQKSPLIRPDVAARVAIHDERVRTHINLTEMMQR
jgi:hypothetical protein